MSHRPDPESLVAFRPITRLTTRGMGHCACDPANHAVDGSRFDTAVSPGVRHEGGHVAKGEPLAAPRGPLVPGSVARVSRPPVPFAAALERALAPLEAA